ncbi:MAG: hypothetical protein ACOVK2_05570 [Candidatus Fonsibacter sp.]
MRYLLILLFLLTSCGTRKVNKSTEETKQDKVETVQNNIQVKENAAVKVIDSTDEISIEPIDSIKPMVIDGKSYLNVKIKHKKRKVNTSIVLDKTTSDTSKKKTVEKIEVVKDDKVIERKTSLVTQLWWLWLLILLFILYKLK